MTDRPRCRPVLRALGVLGVAAAGVFVDQGHGVSRGAQPEDSGAAAQVRIFSAGTGPTASAATDIPVYSSTLGREAFDFFTGLAGDDILMTGSPGCMLSRYRIRVDGDTDGGGLGPFSVNFALYRDCPRLGPSIIPGTAGSADLPDEGDYIVEFIVPPEVEVPLPQEFWIGASFDRYSAGWVGGYPAEIGYSRNRYADPVFGCNWLFGSSFPDFPYAALYAEVFVREPCPKRFAAYRSTFPERPGLPIPPGTIIADDLRLSVPDCRLSGYEFGMRDTGLVKVQLRQDAGGLPGEAIAGSEVAASPQGFFLQIIRREFDPPVPVAQDLWVSLELLEGSGLLPLVAPPPTIGDTHPTVVRRSGSKWVSEFIPDPLDFSVGLGLYVSLYCAGEAPLGACCDPYLPEEEGAAVCRDAPQINCPYPPRGSTLLPQWHEGVTCGANPFDPPCGFFACCRPHAVCENLSRAQCVLNGVSWSEGVYCEGLQEACPFVCIPSFQECTVPHQPGGCSDPFCCQAVCADDPFCCESEWDSLCVLSVTQLCSIPPANDECAPDEQQDGATLVTVPTPEVLSDHRRATENAADPGFCCHAEQPGARGVGTVWYKFVATGPVAELSTCLSNSPASDSLLQLLAVQPHDADESDCDHLEVVACNDNAPNCSAGNRNSRLCVTNLVPGQTYYVVIAAKDDATRGNYRLKIATSCIGNPPQPCPCPAGSPQWVDPPDGVVDARSPRGGGGIATFVTIAPEASDRLECWSLCTEGGAGSQRTIDGFTVNGSATQVHLDQALAPGSAATLSYTDGLGVMTTASFAFHPGNVNSDNIADENDVIMLVDALEGTQASSWGPYSQDTDGSGLLTPLDLWEEINVLLGAELPAAWLGTSAPTPQSCP